MRNVKIIVATRDIGCGFVAGIVLKSRGGKLVRVYSTQRGGEDAKARAAAAALAGYRGAVKPANFVVTSVHIPADASRDDATAVAAALAVA